jgi:hypothetical protein
MFEIVEATEIEEEVLVEEEMKTVGSEDLLPDLTTNPQISGLISAQLKRIYLHVWLPSLW